MPDERDGAPYAHEQSTYAADATDAAPHPDSAIFEVQKKKCLSIVSYRAPIRSLIKLAKFENSAKKFQLAAWPLIDGKTAEQQNAGKCLLWADGSASAEAAMATETRAAAPTAAVQWQYQVATGHWHWWLLSS
ncbi:hypothetical protein V5799_007099, partial [Amblyomma americanum]